MSRKIYVTTLALGAMLPFQSINAAVAPKDLYGKSVVVIWNETLEAVPDKKIDRVGVYVVLTAYVSTAGRVFTQVLRGGGLGSHRTKTALTYEAPGERSGGSVKQSSVEFAGRSLVVTSRFENGARRIVVDFEPTFSACQGKVIHGKEIGKDTMQHTGLSGQAIEVRSVTVSNVTCAIREGNALSGGS